MCECKHEVHMQSDVEMKLADSEAVVLQGI